jgi:fimbrial chaperone protein
MHTFLRTALVGLVALAVPAESWAGVFSVTPVRIYLSPRDRAVAVTVTNDGDEELVMQADIYTWKQKPGGEDDLVLSEDLVLFPPILKLAPKARQVVRLAMMGTPPVERQGTYRLIMREIPEAKQAEKNIQLQVALAFSLPVFITPPNVKSRLDCTAERSAADAVRIACANSGLAYAQPREVSVSSAAGTKLASRESGLYILPGVRRSYDLKRADGPIPGGKLKVGVTLDDGTTQDYDVSLPD